MSPDGQHVAQLVCEGEVRFGPRHYALVIDGHLFAGRTFGHAGEWSGDSRFFATQEWKPSEPRSAAGPELTFLLLVDVDERVASRAVTVKGMVDPVVFIDSDLRYIETVYEDRANPWNGTWREVFMPSIKDWQAFSQA